MIDCPAFRALLRLELARTLPQISRTLGLAAVAAAALAVFGGVTSSRLVLLMTFVAVSGTGAVFQNVIRDKLEGGLDFLVSLPVDRRVLALSRAAACGALAVPAGACLTAAGTMALRAANAHNFGALTVAAAFVLATAGMTAVAMLGMGLSLRLKVSHFANLIVVGFLAGLGTLWLLSHALHLSRETLLALATTPWFLPAFIVAITGLLVFAGWLGYYLAWTGLDRFSPGRDQVDW